MNFDEYQQQAGQTAVYKNRGKDLAYPTLGLVGEAGEVAEKIKKIYRDKDGVVDDDERQAIKKELGDVLWYMAELATTLGLSLSDIASVNIAKLQKRQKTGKLHGSGDNREEYED